MHILTCYLLIGEFRYVVTLQTNDKMLSLIEETIAIVVTPVAIVSRHGLLLYLDSVQVQSLTGIDLLHATSSCCGWRINALTEQKTNVDRVVCPEQLSLVYFVALEVSY